MSESNSGSLNVSLWDSQTLHTDCILQQQVKPQSWKEYISEGNIKDKAADIFLSEFIVLTSIAYVISSQVLPMEPKPYSLCAVGLHGLKNIDPQSCPG